MQTGKQLFRVLFLAVVSANVAETTRMKESTVQLGLQGEGAGFLQNKMLNADQIQIRKTGGRKEQRQQEPTDWSSFGVVEEDSQLPSSEPLPSEPEESSGTEGYYKELQVVEEKDKKRFFYNSTHYMLLDRKHDFQTAQSLCQSKGYLLADVTRENHKMLKHVLEDLGRAEKHIRIRSFYGNTMGGYGISFQISKKGRLEPRARSSDDCKVGMRVLCSRGERRHKERDDIGNYDPIKNEELGLLILKKKVCSYKKAQKICEKACVKLCAINRSIKRAALDMMKKNRIKCVLIDSINENTKGGKGVQMCLYSEKRQRRKDKGKRAESIFRYSDLKLEYTAYDGEKNLYIMARDVQKACEYPKISLRKRLLISERRGRKYQQTIFTARIENIPQKHSRREIPGETAEKIDMRKYQVPNTEKHGFVLFKILVAPRDASDICSIVGGKLASLDRRQARAAKRAVREHIGDGKVIAESYKGNHLGGRGVCLDVSEKTVTYPRRAMDEDDLVFVMCDKVGSNGTYRL